MNTFVKIPDEVYDFLADDLQEQLRGMDDPQDEAKIKFESEFTADGKTYDYYFHGVFGASFETSKDPDGDHTRIVMAYPRWWEFNLWDSEQNEVDNDFDVKRLLDMVPDAF